MKKRGISLILALAVALLCGLAYADRTDGIRPKPAENVHKVQETFYQTVTAQESTTVKERLQEHSTEGFEGEAGEVLETMYGILEEIITPDMLDQDKVRAIHDYLINHADYYEGDLDTRPGWSSAIAGVLIKGRGVCNSYALAFYAMATAEGLDCRMVCGNASNALGTGDHAWNKVLLGGVWYYIDCTWDDPIGGGYENYDYYLTPSLWTDHVETQESDPGEQDEAYWQKFYLTGELW